MPDVGDGLTMSVKTSEPRKSMQIDWGGFTGSPTMKAEEAYEASGRFWGPEPETFVISHFHFDHYKGLAYAAHDADDRDRFAFEEAYYPRLPNFVDFWNRKKFARALEAINLRLGLATFGDISGLPSYDFLVALEQVSSASRVTPNALHEGVDFTVGGEPFQVLWPPLEITGSEARTTSIKKARNAFNKALQNDHILRRLYEELEIAGLEQEIHTGDRGEDTDRESTWHRISRISELLEELAERLQGDDDASEEEGRDLPAVTEKASDRLQKAADDFSLVFRHKENSLLFLGDNYSGRLKEITEKLEEEGDNYYSILITSHHGTRFDRKGKNGMASRLGADLALSSAGVNRKDDLEPLYLRLARLHLTTFGNGDIHAGDWSFFDPHNIGLISGLRSLFGPTPDIAFKKNESSPSGSPILIKCDW